MITPIVGIYIDEIKKKSVQQLEAHMYKYNQSTRDLVRPVLEL